MDRVQEFAGVLTHVVQVDATSEAALRQIGAPDLDVAVVAIGSDIEASVLATSALIDIGVKEVWAKAITAPHGRILERIGATHVVFPEAEVGERVAHLLTGKMIDFIQFDDDFAIVKTKAPAESHGRTLGESAHANEVRRHDRRREAPGPGLHVRPPRDRGLPLATCSLLLARTGAVEKFAAIT